MSKWPLNVVNNIFLDAYIEQVRQPLSGVSDHDGEIYLFGFGKIYDSIPFAYAIAEARFVAF